MREVQIPVGRGERIPISRATADQLRNFVDWQSQKLRKEPHSPFAAKNREQLAAAERRLEELQSGGGQTQQVVHQPQVLVPKLELQGTAISDAARINELFERLSRESHLITPVTRVEMIPQGWGIQVSFVQINPDPGPNGEKHVFSRDGDLGLSAVALKLIATAADLHWAHHESGVLDDRKDPHYVHYRAVGYHQTFDGRWRPVNGEVELDARDGSALIERIKWNAQQREGEIRKKNPKYRGDDGRREILELRTFLLRRAQTMAKSRAVVDMGVRRYYARDELLKPFAVARLVFTGHCSDPELARRMQLLNTERMLSGISAMYPERPSVSRISRRPEEHGHAAPDVGSVDVPEDAFDGDLYDVLEPNSVSF